MPIRVWVMYLAALSSPSLSLPLSMQAAAAAVAKLRAPSGLPGLSANRDTRAARIFKAEERTEEDELVGR